MASVGLERPRSWPRRFPGKGLIGCIAVGGLLLTAAGGPGATIGRWIDALEDGLANRSVASAHAPSEEVRAAAATPTLATAPAAASLSFDISRPDRWFAQARPFAALFERSTASEPAAGTNRELLCLTQAVYYEAGNQSTAGQRAVAQVVLNRVHHPLFPKTVCGVVYEGSQRRTGCQFTFTCDGSLARRPAPAAWRRAEQVARDALSGVVFPGVGSATHYHADYVVPSWAAQLTRLTQIGAHIFYSWPGRGALPGVVPSFSPGAGAVPPALAAGIKPTLKLYLGAGRSRPS